MGQFIGDIQYRQKEVIESRAGLASRQIVSLESPTMEHPSTAVPKSSTAEHDSYKFQAEQAMNISSLTDNTQ